MVVDDVGNCDEIAELICKTCEYKGKTKDDIQEHMVACDEKFRKNFPKC